MEPAGAGPNGYLSTLEKRPDGPEEIAVLTAAYEATLKKLRLVDRSDPVLSSWQKRSSKSGNVEFAIQNKYLHSPSRSWG
jgi:hypothetical protein